MSIVMKIKLPYSALSFTVELKAEEEYGELRKQICLVLEYKFSISGALFDLSLNGRDAIVADWDIPIKDLGIVSGDILRIISEDDAFKNLTMDSGSCSDEKLRSDNDSQTTEGLQSQSSKTSLSNTSVSNWESNAVNDNQTRTLTASSSAEDICDDPEAPTEELSPLEAKLINRHLNEPILCRESTATQIPTSLEQAYKSAGVVNRVDALIVALHVLMSESGLYQVCDLPPMSSLMDTWKSHGNVYNMRYSYSSCPEKQCQLTCFSMGDNLIINGLVLRSNQSENAFTMNIVMPKYILNDPSTSDEPVMVYRNLANLSQKFKDTVAYPMLKVIQIDAGFVVSFELMSLPAEVKLHLLSFLECPHLLTLSSTCKEFNLLCNEQNLWKKLYLRKFSTTSDVKSYLKTPSGPSRELTWKEKYRRAYLYQMELAELRRKRNLVELLPHPYSNPSNPQNYMYIPPTPPTQYIIGGDHDRYPHLPGWAPSGIPAIPGIPPGFRGPRIDPVDPLGNIRFPGSRRPPRGDPFGIGRPRFDPFGGMGGFF